MNFNHPCKELVWVVQRDSFVDCADATINPFKGQQRNNYSDWWDRSVLESGYSVTRVEGLAGYNPVVTAKIQLNGHDRFDEREGKYFNLVQPYQHHTNIPDKFIYSYSFALQPQDIQPSGTCNFSRIDSTRLEVVIDGRCFYGPSYQTGSTTVLGNDGNTGVSTLVFARNWNVLRFKYGLGGLRFAN
jgi:hypothetical protein